MLRMLVVSVGGALKLALGANEQDLRPAASGRRSFRLYIELTCDDDGVTCPGIHAVVLRFLLVKLRSRMSL